MIYPVASPCSSRFHSCPVPNFAFERGPVFRRHLTGLIFILGCRLACEAVLVLFQIRDTLAGIQKDLNA